MWQRFIRRSLCLAALTAGAGCSPELLGLAGGKPADTVADTVANIVAADQSVAEPALDTSPVTVPESTASAQTAVGPVVVSGSVSGSNAYQLFDLGAAGSAEQWTVVSNDSTFTQRTFLLVLFNAEYDLLQRQLVSSGLSLEHVVRVDTSRVYLGVAPAYGSSGGDFQFEVRRRSSVPVPRPHKQVVWLNFQSGQDVQIHSRGGVSFDPFDAAVLGPEYVGTTEEMKAAIVAAMREDYAPYNVVVTTSDEGPPPATPYATLHFGGEDEGLLGLADSIDQYNVDQGQEAIIYVESFADFAVMRLSADEMGQMIGNVASHEFGHLLGLFHTRVPEDLMDTTGTAWDLAEDQSFLRAELEPSVFPCGFENSVARLGDAVGRNPQWTGDAAKTVLTEKSLRKAELRARARQELRVRCGNCRNPD